MEVQLKEKHDVKKNKNTKTILASLMIIAAGMLWGSMGVFVRTFNSFGLDSFQISVVRCIFSFIEIVIFLLIVNRGCLLFKVRDLWIFACGGIFSLAFFNICYFNTIRMLSLSAAAVLLYTAPAFVLLMSAVFFSEKITRRKVGAVIITFCGCFLVSGVLTSNLSVSLAGILFGLGSGIGYALYSIFSRVALNRGYNSLTITTYTFFFAALATCLLADLDGIIQTTQSNPALTALYAVYALLTGVLPYVLYNKGLETVENSRAAVMATVEPVVATLLGIIVFKEMPTIIGWLGIGMVLGGIVLLNIAPKNGTAGRKEKA